MVNIDVTVFLNGYHGDTSRTFFVGKPAAHVKRLVEANQDALQEAIKVGVQAHHSLKTVVRLVGLLVASILS